MLKRIVVIGLSLLIVLCCLPMSVLASEKADEKILVILGDSIATGYSLSDYDSKATPKSRLSWATRLANACGAKQYNLAVDGDTVSDLYDVVSDTANAVVLSKADAICISICGNDMLHLMAEFLSDYDPSKSIEPEFDETLSEMEKTLEKTFALLKVKAGPETEIMVQTLYNPFQYWTVLINESVSLRDWLSPFINRCNDLLKEKAEKHGFHCVDVYASYDNEHSREYLYSSMETGGILAVLLAISKADPHPTEKGHAAIFNAYLSDAKDALSRAFPSGFVNNDKDRHNPDVIYIAVGAAIVIAGVIVLGIIIKRRRSSQKRT